LNQASGRFPSLKNEGDKVDIQPGVNFKWGISSDLGWNNNYMLYMNLKPNKRLQIMLSFQKQTFWEEKGGEEVYDFNVLRTRTTYQISKTLSLRAIVDYNHFYEEVYGSFLVSWILRPGTVFFFGVDSNYLEDEFGRFDRAHRSVFIKFSYWWRM